METSTLTPARSIRAERLSTGYRAVWKCHDTRNTGRVYIGYIGRHLTTVQIANS